MNLLGVDDLADFGFGRLDLGNFRGDGDLLGLRGDFEDDVHRGGLADGEDDAFVYVGGEALKRDRQIVAARGQVRNGIESRVVGGGVVLRVGGSFLQSEGSALDGGAAFVADGAAQLGARDLCEGRSGEG